MNIGIEAQRMLRHHRHGMDVVALEMINHLQMIDTNNQYHIFAKTDENWSGVKKSSNFHYHTIKGGNYVYWEQIKLPKAVKKHQLKLLHCTANTAPFQKTVPLILTLHDIIFMEKNNFDGTAYQNFGNLYRKWIMKSVVSNCDEIITVSDSEKHKICNYFQLPASKVTTVYNGINQNFRVLENSELQSIQFKYQLPVEFILFFANPAPKKNASNVILAYAMYAKNTDSPLPLLLTDTSIDFVNKLIELHKIQSYRHLIKVIDYVPYIDIPKLYNLARLFLYPSINESFGLPLVESMACGTPVIASDIPALQEVGGEAATYVPPLAIEKMAQTIGLITQDKNIAQKATIHGIERAKKFSWLQNAQQVREIYKKYL
jgi:glycosyltransferase involved in cell wall biosynthesis